MKATGKKLRESNRIPEIEPLGGHVIHWDSFSLGCDKPKGQG